MPTPPRGAPSAAALARRSGAKIATSSTQRTKLAPVDRMRVVPGRQHGVGEHARSRRPGGEPVDARVPERAEPRPDLVDAVRRSAERSGAGPTITLGAIDA